MHEALFAQINSHVGQLALILKKNQVAGACLMHGYRARRLILIPRCARNVQVYPSMAEIHQAAAIEPFGGVIATITLGCAYEPAGTVSNRLTGLALAGPRDCVAGSGRDAAGCAACRRLAAIGGRACAACQQGNPGHEYRKHCTDPH